MFSIKSIRKPLEGAVVSSRNMLVRYSFYPSTVSTRVRLRQICDLLNVSNSLLDGLSPSSASRSLENNQVIIGKVITKFAMTALSKKVIPSKNVKDTPRNVDVNVVLGFFLNLFFNLNLKT